MHPKGSRIWHGVSLIATVVGCSAACLAHPAPGIVCDSKGRAVFVDFTKDRVLRTAVDGKVEVLCDGAKTGLFSVPHHLSINDRDEVFVGSDRGGTVSKIGADGKGSRFFPSEESKSITFVGFGGNPVAVDSANAIWCTNERQGVFSQVLRIDSNGMIGSIAGAAVGHADGKADAARFGDLHHSTILCEPQGSVLLTDRFCVRRLTRAGVVTTIAGSTRSGCVDGPAERAEFGTLGGLARRPDGSLLLIDIGNRRLRVLDHDGKVSTLIDFAKPTGEAKNEDHNRPAAKPIAPTAANGQDPATVPKRAAVLPQLSAFQPTGVAVSPSGIIFVLGYPNLGDDRPLVVRIELDMSMSIVADAKKAQ